MSTLPSAFNRLAWSNLAAQSAEQVALAAAPMVAVLALGAGAGETGLLQTAQTLPFLVLAVPAGVLADRMSGPRLMAGAEALRALALAGVLVLGPLGLLTLPRLALLGFVGACGTVAYSVAAPALLPALVPAAGPGRRQRTDRAGAHGCLRLGAGAGGRARRLDGRGARLRVRGRAVGVRRRPARRAA
jgi:MFS family permease